MISFHFKMEYIVDVQGFKGCNEKEFIFKEVAIISMEEDATPSVFFSNLLLVGATYQQSKRVRTDGWRITTWG